MPSTYIDAMVNATGAGAFFTSVAVVYDAAWGSGIWKLLLYALIYVCCLIGTEHWGAVSAASFLLGLVLRYYGNLPPWSYPFLYFMIVVSFAIMLYEFIGGSDK